MENILRNKVNVMKNPDSWLPWNYHKTLEALEASNGRQGFSIKPG